MWPGRVRVQHIQFCIDEDLAEIDATLAADECVRALAQLDERSFRGETLVAVDGAKLRAHLQQQIDALPLAAARHKALELSAVIGVELQPVVAVQPVPIAMIAQPAEVPDTAASFEPQDAPRAIQVGTTIRRRPAWQKPMRERLAEAAAASATVAVVVASLCLTPLLPLAGGFVGSVASAIEPTFVWLGWAEDGQYGG